MSDQEPLQDQPPQAEPVQSCGVVHQDEENHHDHHHHADGECCHHDHSHDDEEDDDEDYQQTQQEFRIFVMERYPQEELAADAEDVAQQKLSKLLEEFTAIKVKQQEDLDILQEQVKKVQERFPKECADEWKPFFTLDFWVQNMLYKEEFTKVNNKYYDPYTSVFEDPDYILNIPEKRSVSNHILSIPLFPKEFCTKIISFVAYIQQWLLDNDFNLIPPNSMNRYGLTLEYVGLEDLFKELMQFVVTPLIPMYYPYLMALLPESEQPEQKVDGDGKPYVNKPKIIDNVHAFTVQYYNKATTNKDIGAAEQQQKADFNVESRAQNHVKLDLHVDASHLTMSLLLNDAFEGGELECKGFRCQQHVEYNLDDVKDLSNLEQTQKEELAEDITIKQTCGYVLIHPGMLRHAAKPITGENTERHNLIIWGRNNAMRKAHKSFISPCLLCAFDVVVDDAYGHHHKHGDDCGCGHDHDDQGNKTASADETVNEAQEQHEHKDGCCGGH